MPNVEEKKSVQKRFDQIIVTQEFSGSIIESLDRRIIDLRHLLSQWQRKKFLSSGKECYVLFENINREIQLHQYIFAEIVTDPHKITSLKMYL